MSGAGIALSVRLSYPGFQLNAAFDIPGAGVTALFGASGSGKTTCLRLLAGLERGRGSLHALGECWQDDAQRRFVPAHRRAVGYVFQEPSLFSHLSVRQNLAYAESRRRSGAALPSFDSVVTLLGLTPLLARAPDRLSGGERQRVALGRALLGAPRLLLLDEPLSALDDGRKAELLPYLERLRHELPSPIVYVSHSVAEVARLADQVILLENGAATAAGPPSELFCRLDLPCSLGDDACVVIDARVAVHDAIDGLTRLDFDGGSLWVARVPQALGARARARVLARDVSLSADAPGPSSILNVLPARVTELADEGPNRVLVRLAVGARGMPLLARITRRSRAALQLGPGTTVFAQLKSVALG